MWIAHIFGAILKLGGIVATLFSIGSNILHIFIKFITGNKLFLTIFFLTIAFAIWELVRDSVDDVIEYMMPLPDIQKMNASFLARIIDLKELKDFVFDLISAIITYFGVCATALGVRFVFRLHQAATDSIKV